MWGPYYGMFIVTEKKREDERRDKYYKEQRVKLDNGEIKEIVPFKEYSVNYWKF